MRNDCSSPNDLRRQLSDVTISKKTLPSQSRSVVAFVNRAVTIPENIIVSSKGPGLRPRISGHEYRRSWHRGKPCCFCPRPPPLTEAWWRIRHHPSPAWPDHAKASITTFSPGLRPIDDRLRMNGVMQEFSRIRINIKLAEDRLAVYAASTLALICSPVLFQAR